MKKHSIYRLLKTPGYLLLAFLLMFSGRNLFAQRQITGIVTGEESGLPVAGVEIYFTIIGEGPAGGSMTGQDGRYRFYSGKLDIEDQVHLQAWNFCNGQWEQQNFFVTILNDTTNFDFMVCTDDEPCEAFFEYDVEGLEVSFSELCSGPVYEFFWSFGDGTNSFEPNPEHIYSEPGLYMVELFISAENNCFDSYETIINVGDEMVISGTVYAGTTPVPKGEVFLFDVAAPDEVLNATELDSAGKYSFSVIPFKDYFLLAKPDIDPGIPHVPVYFPTYTGNTPHWADAEIISVSGNTMKNISLENNSEMFLGDASVSGSVKDFSPESTLMLFLLNQSGSVMDYCFPEPDGSFSFQDIPFGDYFLYPECSGKTSRQAYIPVNESNSAVEWVSIVESSSEVEVVYNVGLDDLNSAEVKIYPVPAKNYIHLTCKNKMDEIVVKTVSGQMVLYASPSQNSTTLNVSGLQSGIYLLAIQLDDGNTSFSKVLIQN